MMSCDTKPTAVDGPTFDNHCRDNTKMASVDINEINGVTFIDTNQSKNDEQIELRNDDGHKEWFSGLFEEIRDAKQNTRSNGDDEDSGDEWDFETVSDKHSQKNGQTDTVAEPADVQPNNEADIRTDNDRDTSISTTHEILDRGISTSTAREMSHEIVDTKTTCDNLSEKHNTGDIRNCNDITHVDSGVEALVNGRELHSESLTECQVSVEILDEKDSSKSMENQITEDTGYGTTIDETTNELESAKSEWDSLDTVTPVLDGVPHETTVKSSHIEYKEALDHFLSLDPSQYQSEIRPEIQRSFFKNIYHLLFGPPKLDKSLISERNLVFTAAACPFDQSNPIHSHILMTIYRTLTGVTLDPPRYGNHWDQVGFQGTDPATDLRSAGMLGLVQLLYFVTDKRTQTLARKVYKLSHDETQNFPFCLMGMNITCMSLNALRHGGLNRECNKKNQVFGVICDFYVALFYHFYDVWKTQNKTMLESGYVIKDLEKESLSNYKSVMKRFEDFLLTSDTTQRDTTTQQHDRFTSLDAH